MQINEWVRVVHDNAVAKGFWDKPCEFGTLIALVHSEASEALEADRMGDNGNLAEELADIVIRVMDICGGRGIDLEAVLNMKHQRNIERPRLHGKRY